LTHTREIAYHVGRRDEVPNQELVAHLVKKEFHQGIEEIVRDLQDKIG
jgi:hypothetical protein